jgi:hypothetical protein
VALFRGSDTFLIKSVLEGQQPGLLDVITYGVQNLASSLRWDLSPDQKEMGDGGFVISIIQLGSQCYNFMEAPNASEHLAPGRCG